MATKTAVRIPGYDTATPVGVSLVEGGQYQCSYRWSDGLSTSPTDEESGTVGRGDTPDEARADYVRRVVRALRA